MSIELIVPTLGESITEATVSKWLKEIGEPFEVDEPLVEIERSTCPKCWRAIRNND